MGDLREMMQARRAEHTLAALRRQAAQRETRSADMVVRLPLADITVDERVQVRLAGLDEATVATYATVFSEGGEFPPVVVFRDERDGELYLADGFHRVAAAQRAGLTEIAATVRPGGLAGAVEYAEEANLTHGLNLTTRDKRAIFERRMARGHEWTGWSNRALAAALGVDEGTIRNWRKALETGAEFSAPAPDKRIGADGKVYDVRNIQAASKGRGLAATLDEQRVYECQQDILSLLDDMPLDYQTLRTRLGIRQDDRIGLAALRVALNRLLETGRVLRDGPRYWLQRPEGAALVGAVREARARMEMLAAALDEVLALSVSDQALGDPAVRQALEHLWDTFPPLRERLVQTEEHVEVLLRQAIEGIMGGLGERE